MTKYVSLTLHMDVNIYKRAKIAAAIKEVPFKKYCTDAVYEDSALKPDQEKINFFRGYEKKKKGDKDYKVVKLRVRPNVHNIFKARCKETGETIIDLLNRTLKEKLTRESF